MSSLHLTRKKDEQPQSKTSPHPHSQQCVEDVGSPGSNSSTEMIKYKRPRSQKEGRKWIPLGSFQLSNSGWRGPTSGSQWQVRCLLLVRIKRGGRMWLPSWGFPFGLFRSYGGEGAWRWDLD